MDDHLQNFFAALAAGAAFHGSKKYDETAERLKDLQKQKQDYENRQIIEAYRKSNKSLDEVMIFLGE